MQNPAALFRSFSKVPALGPRLFSRAVTLTAPYFATIAPRFVVLEPGRVEVAMKNRRAVHNHIGTVHAIACCNLCELAAGTMIEATLPSTLRWIPRGMTVRYLKKAETDLVARARMDTPADDFVGDSVIAVQVFDTREQVVMEADIAMYVSRRK
ncbi:MAG: hotdog fold domain-containing protein [Polyangiales bacterium]